MSQSGLSASPVGRPPAVSPKPGRYDRLLVGSAILLALTIVAAWAGTRQLDDLSYDLDTMNLRQAEQTLNAVVDQQRARLIASVRILAEDTRIRSTALTTGFDEGTIRDILDDLKKASDVSVLAVLDEKGKVRAITGAENLRQLDLSSSPAVKAALERPISYFWTLPGQVVVLGIAPIREGPRVAALLLMGLELGRQQLGTVQSTLGVGAALFSGDRMIASSSDDPKLAEIFRAAQTTAQIDARPVPAYPEFVARVTRISDSATAAKLVWLVSRHRQSPQRRPLEILTWIPVLFAASMFGLTLLVVRKRKGGI